MEFGLLGPLTVRAGGLPVPVPQGKQRVLLAALLLSAGQVVSLDDLAEALWSSYPPPSARVTIQNYVRRLRRALGHEGTRIVTHPNGYAIIASTAELDLAQFRAGLSASRAAARDGAWETAVLQARTALSLWRGAPLADVDSDQLRERHEPRLEETRLQLLETRIDAELRLGYDAQLIAELRQLIAEHPLREHLRAQLMLALYRDGRQAEALAAYADAREVLVAQLGADPGPELRSLHQRMLTADPALILPATGVTATDTGTEPAEGRRGRAPSPYRGLAAFSEADAELFFGRENAAAQVLGRLSAALAETGIVVVSGVSGAGKSSLLRAGVLPQLRHFGLAAAPQAASWPRVVFSPGSDPLGELAVRIAPLAGIDAALLRDRLAADPSGFALTVRQAAPRQEPQGSAGGAAVRTPHPADAEGRRVVLVVDQCEELFTVCESLTEREAFVAALHAAASGPHPAALVVLVIRADFEARLADFPELSAAVQDRYLLTAMTARQLRLAITRPAATAGAPVDEDLVRALLDEVRATAGVGEPGGSPGPGGHGGAGVLPLLSHALDQTWRNGAGAMLTLADYERTGGIEGAVAASAQRAYESLTPPQQEAARRVFARLTATGDDGTDTAARVPRADLAGPDVEAVLETFAAERLLTLDADTVEITHEALLTAWPLLRDTWLADARADRVVRTRLQATATEWDQSGRDSSYLYAGTRLETAESTAARIAADPRHAPLSRPETDFLHASRRAWRRRARTRRQVTALLLALITGLTTVFVVAVRADQSATTERNIAVTQRDIAASRLLASESETTGEGNATTTTLKAIAAWTLNPSPQARAALLAAAASPEVATMTTADEPVNSVAVSQNDNIIATGSGGGSAGTDIGVIQLWAMSTGEEIGKPFGWGQVLGFSADGKTLVTYVGNTVWLWDIASHQHSGMPIIGTSSDLIQALLTSSGNTLVTLDEKGDMQRWDIATGHQIGRSINVDSFLKLRAISPNGEIVATFDNASFGGASYQGLGLWNLGTGREIETVGSGADDVAQAAFGPDGKTIATLDVDGGVRLWSVATGHEIGRAFNSGSAGTNIQPPLLALNGRTLATDSDGVVRLWEATTGQQIGGPYAGGQANAITFSPDGTTLVTGNEDGTARLWRVATAAFRPIGTGSAKGTGSPGAGFGPDGKTLVTVSDDGAVRVWNVSTGQQLGKTFSADITAIWAGNSQPVGNPPDAIALSPDGRTLATGIDGIVQLWNAATGQSIGNQFVVPNEPTLDESPSLTFIADGKELADEADGSVGLWNAATGQPTGKLPPNENVMSAVVAPNGIMLAASSSFGPVSAWNVKTGNELGRPFAAGSGPIGWMAASQDGKTLAIFCTNGDVHVWNVDTGQQISSMSGSSQYVDAAFSPVDGMLATVDGDGTIQLWDTATGRQIGDALTGDRDATLAFSPSGRTLAIVNGSGAVQLWNVSYLTDPLETLCARIGGTFTPQEWAQYVPPGPAYRNPCT